MTDQLEDYKQEVPPTLKGRLEWQKDLLFTATTQRGYDLDFDSQSEWGCMPLESLFLSLAGCLAIDMVAILTKMRCPPSAYRMEIEAERSTTPPQRLLTVDMIIYLSGEDLPEDKVQRALRLSEEKYCSVRHSLREDIAVRSHVIIE